MSKKEELLTKLTKLAPEKRAFLEKQLQSKTNEIIPRRLKNDSPVLSFAQQRLWFLEQLEPGRSIYNMPFAIQLKGTLHLEVFEACLKEITTRHEVLRTTFTSIDGEPIQVIQPSMPISLEVIDLRPLPEEERQKTCEQQLAQEANRPFSLQSGPLLRSTLWQLSDEDCMLLINMHHIAGDGWSTGILIREIEALYTAFLKGMPSPFPPLDIQYADFALWQRQWLEGEVLSKELQYWKQQLSGELPVLQLPTDRPRASIPSYRGTIERIVIPSALLQALRSLSQREGVTLFMTLLAAYNVLLYRYTGQEDLLVGTPIANRQREEIAPLIGFFVNTLVLRNDLSGNISFGQLLQRVRQVCLQAYAHQDIPFEKLVEVLQPERDISHSPLFQTMFAFNPLEHLPQLPGLRMCFQQGYTDTAKFDLSLHLFEAENEIIGSFEYSTDLFDEATITRMAGHWRTLLEGIVADPYQCLSELPLLTGVERQQLLVEWNATATEYPKDQCIHQLFEAQVERTPDVIALIFNDQQMTYRELNRRANQLAHRLQRLGVGPQVMVGLCVDRSFEMVVGLLGILKAGGAYVPLDPSYPRERLTFMLEDTQAPMLLTQEKYVHVLPMQKVHTISLDTGWKAISQEPAENLANRTTAENLAYVMYTSGSTGKPKGVEIRHRSITRLLFGVDYARLDATRTILHMAPISFDAATFEVWGALLHGAHCILFSERIPTPTSIGSLIQKYQVTTVWLTASLFNAIMDEAPETLRGIEQLLTGGEALSVVHIRRALEELPGTQLINGYGPTESTTFTCCYPIPNQLSESMRSIPIGHPIGNTQVYVLDSSLNPVPIGVPGELYIGGVGLARGYLNHPDLTEEKFIAHPFSDELGARLYKTGDLARYLPDGNIEFLSRLDHQIKIRGFRIELGEIEVVLSQHPTIRETAVIARQNERGEKCLVAYVVPLEGQKITFSELRSFLKEHLPDYMVPSDFVLLDAMPLTPNGKVDQRALPAPDLSSRVHTGFVAPCTPIEELVADIWTHVLHLEKIGVHDNFFELGGHSLLATQVISRINSACSLQLPLKTLFDAPTVASLSVQIQKLRDQQEGKPLSSICRVSRDQPLLLSFAQQRLWFLEQLMTDAAAGYNVPSAICLQGQLHVETLEKALNEILVRHEVLRTTFTEINGEPVQVIAESAWVPLPKIHLHSLPAEEREAKMRRLLQEEAQRPFDLATGPLIRFFLFHLGEEEHVLILNMHHIICDGWSIGVLFTELVALYKAFAVGDVSPLAPLAIQYTDYAAWQRNWLQGEVLDQQLAYWKKRLGGDLPVLQLPIDRLRPPIQTYKGSSVSFALSAELTKALHALSRRHGVTLFMTLLGAFQTLLSRYSGQEDIVVGTPIAGRHHQEIEALIGFFVNTLVLRTDLSGVPTFTEVLNRVRDVALEAYAHQDIPFEKLVEALQPERDMSRTPLFQVMFVLQNAVSFEEQLPDLKVREVSYDNHTVKFDLLLSMTERPSGLVGELKYNTDLCDAETIRRQVTHFVTLLEGIAANPDLSIQELPLLTEAERHHLLVEWNDTRREASEVKCIHHLFEEQVQRSPDAVAVVFEGQSLTYRELNERANQLAHALRQCGVAQERVVAICLERSFEMIIALLATFKAGGAYLPLDSSYPTARLVYMLEDARPQVLLATTQLSMRLADTFGPIICLDLEAERIAQLPVTPAAGKMHPAQLAYVMYTSGSTGKPKGVLIEHCSICNELRSREGYRLTEEDRVLHKAPLSFDASVFEIFWPLTIGARLVVARPDGHRDAAYLARLVIEEGITTMHFVPSMLQLFLQEPTVSECTSLRRVFSGGEQLSYELQERFFSCLDAQLINRYGPTETTINATAWICERHGKRDYVPIGRPIANVQAYILDHYLQPLPVGVVGELHIGGAGVARGYLNRLDLTVEKFLPNPFVRDEKARLYKTGDLARYREDGIIEYIGRADSQVKLRGLRIELGEIQSALLQHPSVREAMVIVREDVPGDKRLVAYVIPEKDAMIDTSDLRTYVKKQLPEYMVPSAFLQLDTLPLTSNLKLDHQALPRPESIGRPSGRQYVAPRDMTEMLLVQIWEELLGISNIGVTDNFFLLGGHSLLAIRLNSQIEKRFQKKLPLATLFQSGTIEQMASLLRQKETRHAARTLVPLHPYGTRRPLFFVHPIGGHVLSYVDLAKALGGDQPCYGFQASGLQDDHRPLESVEDLAALYIEEMRTVQPQGPYRIGGWSFGGMVAFEMALQLRQEGEQVEILVLLDTRAPVADQEEELDDLALFAYDLAMHYGQALPEAMVKEYELLETEHERMSYIINWALQMQLLPSELKRGEAERFIQLVRANRKASRTYQPSSTYNGFLLLIRASEEANADETLHWEKFASNMHMAVVPGTHYAIVRPPQVKMVARQLNALLE